MGKHLIQWHEDDIQYLIDNYRHKSNIGIATELNKLKRTFREINGEKVFRHFTKKHVDKKMFLLKIKRNKIESAYIRRRNIEIGFNKAFSNANNLWSNGILQSKKEGDIVIWSGNRESRKYIKINGIFIPYARWYYQNYIGPVPNDCIVFHLDMDCLNDDPKNLEIRKRKKISMQDFNTALQLLHNRELKIVNTIEKNTIPEKEKFFMPELYRVRRLIRKIRSQLNIYTEPSFEPYKEHALF